MIQQATIRAKLMRRLTVKGFSCIQSAELEFAKVTVLIGPQASGKSVLCKLAYFFLDVLSEQPRHLVRGTPLTSYLDLLEEQFRDWFPASAWGDTRFRITFQIADCAIDLVRPRKNSAKLKIIVSDAFAVAYESSLTLVADAAKKSKTKSADFLDIDWSLYSAVREHLNKALGTAGFMGHIYIPAGRAFFTSMGKAVMAFEQSGMLDPITIRFGRMFTTLRDRRFYFGRPREEAFRQEIQAEFAEILGGEYRREDDRESFLLQDGREVPLSALSSGQQELLPLALTMSEIFLDAPRALIFIEELEAHLFPAAQSKTFRSFINWAMRARTGPDLVLTTHSPYVLATMNTLIKAAQLAKKLPEAKKARLEQIVPKKYWLPSDRIRAYCIEDRVVSSIKDEDGLIDPGYLDQVSGEIGEVFDQLLEIEYGS